MTNQDNIKIVATNKKAGFNYEIKEKFEAGIALVGSEVKSIRLGHINIGDAFALIRDGEVFIHNLAIQPYKFASFNNHKIDQPRKLLLHKYEIKRLIGKTTQKGFSLIPLKLYFKNGKIKVEIALASGKKLYDKRQTIKDREEKRSIDRLNRNYNVR